MPATLERTRQIMEAYWGDGLAQECIAEDAVYVELATGERTAGRDAVVALLQNFYRGMFDASPEIVGTTIGEGRAVLEALVVGTHIGEYRGVPGSGKAVRVPLCVSYEVEDDGIKQARIYLMESVLLEQISGP
jgi:steroid delta-isomerase-like uncharacterized protein